MTTSHQVTGLSFTPEQLEARRQTLGASEIPAVAGLNPHQTALDVFLVKRGIVPPFAGNPFTEWGLRLERVICDKYAEDRGVAFDQPGTVICASEPWMSATPDRIVLGPNGERWGLETKNRGARQAVKWGESGTDQIPHDVAAQVHWSMLVTGLDRWDVAVLFGGNEFRSYTLRFDEDIAEALLETGRRFWFEHVVAGVEPALDGSESAHRYLASKFAAHSDLMLDATADVDRIARQLRDVRDRKKAIELEESHLEAHLKAAIGMAAGIQGRTWKATWKAPKSGQVSWKGVAEELGASPELIAKHTGAPSRRFLISFAKED